MIYNFNPKKKGEQISSSLLGELEDRKVVVAAIVLVFLHTIVNIREYILVREKSLDLTIVKRRF